MANKTPMLPNLEPFFAAGIDPKTGLPAKVSTACKALLKEGIKKNLRIKDEQNAVNRFKWSNIPANITSQELERMIYYKGQLCFFYDKDTEQYYFMPYCLDGTIDFYGRYNRVHPVPMTSGTDEKANSRLSQLLSQKKLDCIYTENQIKEDINTEAVCVLIHDYTKQIAQSIIPRAQLQDPILDIMAECYPMMRTALISGTGVKGVRVNDEDQALNVMDANRSIESASMTGHPFVPIVGNVEFQELTDGNLAKADEYLMAFQSLDNFRLGLLGIASGGAFEKKAHELQSEADLNQGPDDLVAEDGLKIRQNFCDLANKLFGTQMSVEKVETQPAEESVLDEPETAEKEESEGETENE